MTNPGQRVYSINKEFLSYRKAVIHVGDLVSDTIHMPSFGTPQVAVLFPLLFNLALLNLPNRLAQIPRLRHSLYANDLTPWCAGGSDAQIEEALQSGIDTVIEQAALAYLECSPSKPELLTLPDTDGHAPLQT